jgi:N-acetylneuraminate synthase
MKTLIIAEAGVNHNGDIALAKRLIECAAVAGADLVKFQSFVTAKSIARYAPMAEYQKLGAVKTESQYDMVRKLELSRLDHDVLLSECERCGIGFFSTAFDAESLELLMELGAERVKVPSGEITNLPFLQQIASCAKPVLLSTGMASLGDVEAAIDVLERGGIRREKITVLHCNTAYPTPATDVNLRAMVHMGRAFGIPFGYSDHTSGIEISVAAVALGASVIEKHVTLDRTLPGPDHRASLEPDEFKAMVEAIRNVENALGDGIKRLSPSEAENRPVARKSLVAARSISAGELFNADNLTVKRPGTGLSPMRWNEVIGRRAPRAFEPDELIEL